MEVFRTPMLSPLQNYLQRGNASHALCVMLGEIHECSQEYDLLSKVVATPAFSERVNDIVMELETHATRT